MKCIFKPIIIVAILFCNMVSSQVAIGKASITKLPDNITTNPNISLEFGDTGNRGIIVPWVSTQAGYPNALYKGMTNPVNGTIVFDLYDEKLKYKIPGGWFDLTVKNKDETVVGIPNTPVNTSLQDNIDERDNTKTIIGTNKTDTADGILVLSDTDKAMVLPLVASYADILSPSAGMMVYDTTNNMLCVFNGTLWTFWKEKIN